MNNVAGALARVYGLKPMLHRNPPLEFNKML